MELPVITAASQEPSDSSVLVLAKIGSMLCLGLGSLLLGTLPLIIGRCRAKSCDSRRVVSSVSSVSASSTATQTDSGSQSLLTSLLLCFGGGVLLFTTFLHLAPEIRESVEILQASGQLADLGSLSLAELLFCAGFFLVYLVEEGVHALLSDKPDPSDALLYRTVSVRRCNHTSPGQHGSNAGGALVRDNNNSVGNGSGSSASCGNGLAGPAMAQRAWRGSEGSDADEEHCKHAGPVFLGAPARHLHLQACEEARLQSREHGHRHDNSMRSLLTVLALSFHSIFEGLAVGLEPALGSVLYLAAAIATHKLVIAFCVGMELYVAGASRRAILGYLSVFSMVTPLGIGIGLGLGHLRSDSQALGPTPTILQGMAAGTLLYVVFFEVLARERANDKSGLLQLAAIFVGFMLMLGLQLATAHSHDHGDHPHGSGGHDRDAIADTHDHGIDQLVTDKHNYVLGSTIEQVTDKVVDVLSTTLT